MEGTWITTEQMLEELENAPNSEHEYRLWLGGPLYSCHLLRYDSQEKRFGDSTNDNHYEMYTEAEFLALFSGELWLRNT